MENKYNIEKFKSIRSYDDSEVNGVITRMMKDPRFQEFLSLAFPKTPKKIVEMLFDDIHSKDEFQKRVIYDVVQGLADNITTTLQCSGIDHLSTKVPYTFISNHRDIILDASWLNILLYRNNFPTTEVAIGDNLFVEQWIEDLTRLNKSFVVKRSVTGREMLEASYTLSEYIHYTIKEKETSVWIAQREGRAKDSNDHTQESLLKMLAMGKRKVSIAESLKELNIVPFSLSYEFDSCDYLKAKEYQLKRDDSNYVKTRKDDYENMRAGLNGFKGRVHFRAGFSINPFLEELDPELSKADTITAIAGEIDRQIHENYHLYPCNYIAYDLLHKSHRYMHFYSTDEEAHFKDYLVAQINKIKIPNKDIVFLRERLLEMYANPFINKMKALGKMK